MPDRAPPPRPEFPWKIDGVISPARLTAKYRFGTGLVAAAMVLLPLLYVGTILVAALFFFLLLVLMANIAAAGLLGILLLLGVLVSGGVVLLFMIKPLFHRRPDAVRPRVLRAEDEPALFAFIERVCDLVKAPRPHRVQVNMEVNASASLSSGLRSLFSRKLTLVIGLPLAGGLTVQQFGGVLAHEFGHFAQGAGMKTTYIVRVISLWLARVVYERDDWDASLEAWARESDWRIMVVLQITRAFVWCARRVLWVLMWIGQLLSSSLMRQMEFDADHYEIQTGGSESFTITARRLRVLGLGAQVTAGKLQLALQEKRLVDDLPGWIHFETANLPPKVCEDLLAAVGAERTGLLDSHPCDAERIARAQRANSPGVLTGEAPATALFADFASLSREATLLHYRDAMKVHVQSKALESLVKMTTESASGRAGEEALKALFHDHVALQSMPFIHPRELAADFVLPVIPIPQEGDAAALAAQLRALEERQAELAFAIGLLELGIAVRVSNGADEGGVNPMEAFEIKLAMAKVSADAVALMEPARQRIVTGLRWLLAEASTPKETVNEVRLLVVTLSRIESVISLVRDLQPALVGLTGMLKNLDRTGDPRRHYFRVRSRGAELAALQGKIANTLGETPYPFEHARGRFLLARHLVDGVTHADGVILTLLRGSAMANRLFAVYARALGRLAVLALETEKARANDGASAAK